MKTQKNHKNVKIKTEKLNHHQFKNLRIRYIETFQIPRNFD
jgi:hypothetical protein